MKALAIIPASAGSKRVPQKNFRAFADTTLTDLAIQQALGAKMLTQIVLSSDAEGVLSIWRKYPARATLPKTQTLSQRFRRCDIPYPSALPANGIA